MNKEFIPYEQALELKELGFDEPCFGYFHPIHNNQLLLSTMFRSYYPNNAPLYQQAFRWFRNKHGFIGIPNVSNYTSEDKYVFDIFQKGNDEIYFEGSDLTFKKKGKKEYDTYEEAELACLNKLIEIVKNK